MSINNDFWQQTRKAHAIDKAKGYFTLPAFALPTQVWRGSSEIIGQFNCSASKNFTISALPVKPVIADYIPYILCIKYRIGGTVYRYKVWSLDTIDNGATILKDTLLGVDFYNGQVIKKNFVLEIWSFQVVIAGIPVANQAFGGAMVNATNFPISIRKIKTTLDESDEHDEAISTEIARADLEATIPQNVDFELPVVSIGDNNAA